MEIAFFMPIPKSKSIKLKGEYHHIRPDLSNLIKMVEDIAQSIVYHDDCIISSISAKKTYDLNPRTEFSFTKLVF